MRSPDYERRQRAVEVRQAANVFNLDAQLHSPIGAAVFASNLEDAEDILGRIMCQVVTLDDDFALAAAVREEVRQVIHQHARWQTEMTGPIDADYAEADRLTGVPA